MKGRYSKRKFFKIIWFSLAALFLAWNWTNFESRNLPERTFLSDDTVSVTETSDEIIFKSLHSARNLEVIFFQGGLADPKAYAPLCRTLAENHFTCHLIKMAWRFPQHDYKKIIGMFDLAQHAYALGGHSQGGKMASQFVYENPGQMKALFLMGTSHPRDIDLSNASIPVIKFYAEQDGLASMEEVMSNKNKLPGDTEWVFIKGGNHSQFGYLGKLLGDDNPFITREEQQKIVSDSLVSFLEKNDRKASPEIQK